MSCIESSNFKFCKVNGVFMVGDNTSNVLNAIVTVSYVGSEISIPSIVLGNKVEEIGQYAFQGCSILKRVIINARIKSINTRAFYGCPFLEYIGIPSSVTYIGDFALRTFLDNCATPGHFYIDFEAKSQISVLGIYAISAKEKVTINFCSQKSITHCGEGMFQYATSKILNSSPGITFCGLSPTSLTSSCFTPKHQVKHSLPQQRYLVQLFLPFLSLVLTISS